MHTDTEHPAARPSPALLRNDIRDQSKPLNISIVVDYQNVHLTANELFRGRHHPAHLSLIHPLHFANTVVAARNAGLKTGHARGVLHSVTCFRGQPVPKYEPDMHRRSALQRQAWMKSDPRVNVVYRPLKYITRKTGYSSDSGTTYEIESVIEKGIDVLCASAVLTESLNPEIDVVILASQDTDLSPSLDAALALNKAKIETVQWWYPEGKRTVGHLRPTKGQRIWNTRLTKDHFLSSVDPVLY